MRTTSSRLARPLAAWAGALAMAMAACGGGGEAGSGALGGASLSPTCDASDDSCLQAGFRAPLAVGSEMTAVIELNVPGSATPSVGLVSVNPDVLEVVDGRRLRGVRQGMSALLILGPGDEVVDFVHVWVRPATALLLRRIGVAGPEPEPLPDQFQLLVGDDFQIGLQQVAEAQPLLGDPAATWSLDAPGIIDLLDPGTAGRRRLVARAPGTVQLTVTSLAQTATITMEVLP